MLLCGAFGLQRPTTSEELPLPCSRVEEAVRGQVGALQELIKIPGSLTETAATRPRTCIKAHPVVLDWA